jgi:hypothetical protein
MGKSSDGENFPGGQDVSGIRQTNVASIENLALAGSRRDVFLAIGLSSVPTLPISRSC